MRNVFYELANKIYVDQKPLIDGIDVCLTFQRFTNKKLTQFIESRLLLASEADNQRRIVT